LLIKFWTFQTGRGLIHERTKLEQLEHFIETCQIDGEYATHKIITVSKAYYDYVRSFLKEYNAYYDSKTKLYDSWNSSKGSCSM